MTDAAATCGFAWGDLDNAGDPDLYVANQGFNPATNSNALYRSDGSRALDLVLGSPLTLDAEYSYEANWEGFDNDGDMDLVIGNWGSSAVLYCNDGLEVFVRSEGGDLSGRIHHTGTMASADYNADGGIDLYLACGPSIPAPGARRPPPSQTRQSRKSPGWSIAVPETGS